LPRKPAILGLIAVAVLWGWQFLTVHYNYGGNWSGLFCIRDTMPRPPFLQSEDLYLFQHSEGYDGQVFHLIAHDPWMRKGSREAIAGASFRYQRIFVPALAWMLAFGQDRWVHASYFAVILAFVYLGVYWTAKFAARAGMAPAWGLAFALTPAAITSIDRMVADVALAAFVAGFALYCGKQANWRVLVIFVCAALTRETALPIIAGYCLFLLSRKQFAGAILSAATVLPAIAWVAFESRGAPELQTNYGTWIPFAGFLERLIHPSPYSLTLAKLAITQVLDYAALAGVALAFALAVRIAIRKEWAALSAAVYASALVIVFLKSRDVWEESYAFGRVLTPFMLLTMLRELSRSPWLALLPIVMVDARVSLNLSGQVLGILRGITGH
jgi:hypothetical protein